MHDEIKIIQLSKDDYQQEVEVQPTPKREPIPEYVMLTNNKHGDIVQDTVKDILGSENKPIDEEARTHLAAACIFFSAALCITIFVFYFLRWW